MKSAFMKNASITLKIAIFSIFLVLAGCGGGSDGGSEASQTASIEGEVLAPGGMVALFEQRSIMMAVVDFLFPSASAMITGLQPVTGARVELIRIDDNGDQAGAVLASTVTSITGNYSLALPSGVSFAGNLVVRITGNGIDPDNVMSAMVVEQSVDITPVSEFILQKFIDDGTALDSLAINEVVALSGRIKAFDLTATADMSTMLAQLEAEAGQFMDNEVAVINSVPGDGATAAGAWKLASFGLGLQGSDGMSTTGTFSMDAGTETVTITDDGNGDLTIAAGVFEGFFTNFTTTSLEGTFIYHEADIGAGDGETFDATVNSDGNIQVSFPFEEELESVDLLTDPDGPDFGWRQPPGIFIVTDTGNGNVKVSLSREASVRYETTDTNNDGIKDAIDPDARSGDEVFLDLDILLKHGSDMSNANLDGDYGIVSLEVEVRTTPVAINLNSAVGVASFDGNGTLSALANALNSVEITRTTSSPGVAFVVESADDPDSLTASYSVGSTGELNLDFGEGDIDDGFVSDDGTLFVIIDAETTDDGGTPASIVTSGQTILVGSKLGIATPDLSGAVYRIFPFVTHFQDSGATELFTSSADSRLTFNSAANSVVVSSRDVGFERSSDITEVTAIVDDGGDDTMLAVSTSGNAAIVMTLNDETDDINVQGFVSADGKLMVLRLHVQDAADASVSQTLGMVLAVRQ